MDALTALAILAATLALALSAHALARRLSDAALETRRAGALLQRLADDRTTAAETGHAPGFDWSIETRPERLGPSDERMPLCLRSVRAQSLATGRGYTLATLVPCPATQPVKPR